MRYNSLNRFHPLFAKHDPDGLSARMEAFLAPTAKPDEPPVASTQDEPPAKPAEVKPAPAAKAVEIKPAAEAVVPANEEDEEDEEELFPEIGKPAAAAKPDAGLDEAAFDAETTKAVEGMDEKAGDKFKALRAELKEWKKKEFKPDLESIPEYKNLKAEALEAQKIREERDGLKARLESVMKTSDELAVKESPEYISKVKGPIKEMETTILPLISEASGIPIEELMALIAEANPAKQDKALEAMERTVPRRTMSKIERLCDDYRVIQQDEQRLLADIPKSLAQARQQQAEQAEQNRKAMTGQFQSAARKSFAEYGHTVPGFTDSAGVLSDTAEAVQAEAVAVDPHSLTPEDLGFMIFASKALAPARKEIRRLQKELSALKAGKGHTIPGKPDSGVKPPAANAPKGETLADRMKGQNFTFNPGMVG